jgi:hypothetical protein
LIAVIDRWRPGPPLLLLLLGGVNYPRESRSGVGAVHGAELA